MRINIITIMWAVLVVIIHAGEAAGQVRKDPRKELSEKLNLLKNTGRMAFKQLMVMNYENGTRDSLLTRMAVDMESRSLYASNANCEITLNRQYYTRTDHVDRTVSVFDMNMYSSRLGFDPEQDDLFNSGMMIQALDTIFNLRLNTVEAVTRDHVTTFTISFPPGFYIRQVELQYHDLLNLPLKYVVHAHFTNQPEAYAGVTGYQVILYDYTRNVDDSRFRPSDHIRIRGGQVELTKYKNYKITTLL